MGNHANGYPLRSQDFMPAETHFANFFHQAQLNLEARERKRCRPTSMTMWKNSLVTTWENCPLEEVQKLIDRQPKIMQKIIEVEGRSTAF